MLSKSNDWSPQLFQQKGWIGTKFQVKNNNGALRWKKRTQTETFINSQHLNNQQTVKKIKAQSTELPKKPLTAPQNHRNRSNIVESLEKIGAINQGW